MDTMRRLSNRRAQATLRARRLAEGLVQVTVWARAGDAAASIVEVADLMRRDPDLRAGLINGRTGKRESMKARK
jgi:hypothetical protein